MKALLILTALFGLTYYFFTDSSMDARAGMDQPIEVGLVHWSRDYEGTLKRSEKEGKTVLMLFQEVPGCSGTQTFGREVLSNPLLVEAIESEFIPLLIYNNQGGEDAELLKKYNEPAWNYQVIRFLDSDGKDLIPRKDHIWTLGAVAGRMSEALKKTGKKVPLYLQGLALENDNTHLKDAIFAMSCFWTGEMNLGSIGGVVKTEAGFLNGREVTRVWYDKRLIAYEELAIKAAGFKCADVVYVSNDNDGERLKAIKGLNLSVQLFDNNSYRRASLSDQKKQLEGSLFKHLDLTSFQLTKVNAFASKDRRKALTYLSPRQVDKFEKLASE